MTCRFAQMLAGAVCGAFALSACVAAPGTPTPSPSVSHPTPSTRFTDPDKVFYILHRIVAASGSTQILKVRITRRSAEMAMLVNGSAQTWAWREGGPQQVDGDTKYVGQARFTLDDFRYDAIAPLFDTATTISGSSQSQEFQVVEYADRRIYLTVTTVPETVTVFFRPDGTLVPRLDLATESGQRKALADVLNAGNDVVRVGYQPNAGVYADVEQPDGDTRRWMRHAWFPMRSADPANPLPTSPLPPHSVDAASLSRLVTTLAGAQTLGAYHVSMNEILRRPVLTTDTPSGPRSYTLDGTDVTTKLKK